MPELKKARGCVLTSTQAELDYGIPDTLSSKSR